MTTPALAPLTLEHAYEVAEHLCAPHRSDVLRCYTSVWQWARSRIELPGMAWACIHQRTVWAAGILSDGPVGILWIGGVDGWTRHVKHAIKLCRLVFASGVHRHYACKVYESDRVSCRFAERLGFREIDASDGLIFYGVTP